MTNYVKHILRRLGLMKPPPPRSAQHAMLIEQLDADLAVLDAFISKCESGTLTADDKARALAHFSQSQAKSSEIRNAKLH